MILPLTNLTSLDLTNNLSVNDNIVMQLTNLKKLVLDSNNTVTDNALGRLTNLTCAHLGNFAGGATDTGLYPLTSLLKLTLGQRSKVTDNAVSRLTNLTHLEASSSITGRGISMLTDLRCLHLHPDAIGDAAFNNLTNLVKLFLFSSGPTDVTMTKMTNLRILHSKFCFYGIKFTSNSISRLTQLEEFVFDQPQLLPAVPALTNLKILRFSANMQPDTRPT